MDSTTNGEVGTYNMSLKNVLIIVDNIDESIDFYEELFGLRAVSYTHLDVYKRQC